MSGTDQSPKRAQLRLLGGFDLHSADGRAAIPAGRKVRALLACLALSPGQAWPREKLMALLWSDRSDEQARASLRQALAEMRRVLGEPTPVHAEHDAVGLDPTLLAVDVLEFERLAKAGKLDEAAALYRGPLLDGHGVRDDAFEDWVRVERTRLHDLAVDVLARLATSQSGKAAIATARRLLQLDPAREETHRLLMRLYAAAGQRAQALRQYDHCRDILQRDLQTKPDTETERLHQQIQNEVMPALSTKTNAARPDSASPADMKASIAVLPFENLSGDPEQEYFADGMVEEITMALSRMRWLFVIARNSSFTYKGRAVDVKQVGRELGVRYVLEGSVRKAGNRVRIAGQLIDASTGAHLWADRFEGELEDIFNLQDQVTANVVGTIRPKLERAEIERAKRKPTESLDAYDYFLRGAACVYRWTREANDEALTLLHRAIERDPDFATAYGMAAWCYVWRKVNGWMADRTQEAAEATRLARRAVELGKDDAVALCWGGIVFAHIGGDLDDGGALIEQSLALDPNSATAWYLSGWVKVWLCEPEAAIERVARAMRLSPLDPLAYNMQSAIAHAHFVAGRYDDAAAWAERAVRQQPPEYTSAIRILAASSALAGRQADAERAAVRLRQVDPTFRICDLEDRTPLRRPEDLARYAGALRKAGLPA
jgi:TolB-like protein